MPATAQRNKQQPATMPAQEPVAQAPTVPLPSAGDCVRKLRDGAAAGEEEAEKLLLKLARGEEVAAQEVARVLALVPWGGGVGVSNRQYEPERQRRVDRCQRIIALQRQVGDPAVYQAAVSAVQEAEREAMAARANLQRETQDLQRAVEVADQKVNELRQSMASMHDARMTLRSFARSAPHLETRSKETREFVRRHFAKIDHAKARCAEFDRLLVLDAALNSYSRHDGSGDFDAADHAYKEIEYFSNQQAEGHPIYLAHIGGLAQHNHVAMDPSRMRPGKGTIEHPNERLLGMWRSWMTAVKRDRAAVAAEIEQLNNDAQLLEAKAFLDSIEDYYLPR